MEYGLDGRPGGASCSTGRMPTPMALLREATVHTLHTQEATRKSSCASVKACSEPMPGSQTALQLRNGFYYAVAFVLACWFLLLTRLPPLDWGYVLPAVIFGNLVMVNFYFVAGLVLLEKDEGTLEGPGRDAARRLGVPRLEDGDAGRPVGGRAGRYRLVGVRRWLRGRPAGRRHRARGRSCIR